MVFDHQRVDILLVCCLGLLGGKLRDKTLCATAKQFIDMHYNLHSLYGYSETVVTDR